MLSGNRLMMLDGKEVPELSLRCWIAISVPAPSPGTGCRVRLLLPP